MMTVLTEGATAALKPLALKGALAQLAESGKKGYPTGEGYVVEGKWDGWRILAHVWEEPVGIDDDNVPIMEKRVSRYSRNGKTYNGKLPKVEAELIENFPAGTWLDGEAVAIRVEEGQVISEWKIAQSVLSKVGAHAAADRITFM